MIVATAGHVDHGKTTLVRALTGTDTDRLPEEKARGLSIDLGFAYQALPGGNLLGFVDVPGHEKFIRNMLAGVAGIDLGLLVVAADDGVMPQTREHLAILDLLGIEAYLVAITRTDRVDEPGLKAVRGQVASLFAELGRDDVEMFPVCAPDNDGIDALQQRLRQLAQQVRVRPADGYFRMAIDRVFTIRGVGLVVTGLVAAGVAALDDRLLLSCNGEAVRVRGIRAHDAHSELARAGERCAINITGRGISESSLRRGDWLLHPELYAPTRRIDVDLRVLASESRALKHWTPTHLHLAADHVAARVAVLGAGSIAPGENGFTQLVLERDIFVVHGDRFVLRDQSARRTIAGGKVLDPFPPKRGRARPARLAALRALTLRDPAEMLAALADSSPAGIARAPFLVAHNLPAAAADARIAAQALRQAGKAPDTRIFSERHWLDLLDRIGCAVDAFHQAQPDSPGPSLRDIELALDPHVARAAIDAALDHLVARDQLARRGARVHRPMHSIAVSDQDRRLWARAVECLAPAVGSPMSLHQAATALGLEANALEASMKRAIKVGEMVQLAKNRYAPTAYVARLGQVAETLAGKTGNGEFSVAEYCQQSETGRNFAIDLLEYFDRLGLTERAGNRRRIRRPAASVFGDTNGSSRGRGSYPGGAPGLQIR